MTFSAMVDAIFDDPIMAQDAVYTPTGGTAWPDPVRITVSHPDLDASPFGVAVTVPTAIVEVRVSEVASPARGDTFASGGAVYTVNADPKRDEDRLVWEMEAVEADA